MDSLFGVSTLTEHPPWMAWKGVLCSLFLLVSLAESSSRSWKIFSQDLGVQTYMLPSWPILSAGIFVMVAVVFSLFLIFEHLSVYNQPEVFILLPYHIFLLPTSYSSNIQLLFSFFYNKKSVVGPGESFWIHIIVSLREWWFPSDW